MCGPFIDAFHQNDSYYWKCFVMISYFYSMYGMDSFVGRLCNSNLMFMRGRKDYNQILGLYVMFILFTLWITRKKKLLNWIEGFQFKWRAILFWVTVIYSSLKIQFSRRCAFRQHKLIELHAASATEVKWINVDDAKRNGRKKNEIISIDKNLCSLIHIFVFDIFFFFYFSMWNEMVCVKCRDHNLLFSKLW